MQMKLVVNNGHGPMQEEFVGQENVKLGSRCV